jgi:predicted DNA-binding transcriptional regulator AlpA
MGGFRTRRRGAPNSENARQLPLAMDESQGTRTQSRRASNRLAPEKPQLEPVLYMADVVRIVRRHRSTILRWIARQQFPPKSVPPGQPKGWLRADIERWKNGSTDANGESASSKTLKSK